MSPGVNDPSTAAAALDALCHLIGQSIERAPPSSRRCDEDGQLRVLLPRWRFVDLIDDTFLRVLQYGEGDVMVMSRLLHACELLLYRTQDEEHAATLWALVDAIHERARTSITLPGHRRQLDDRISSLCRAHGLGLGRARP